jgi:hypothetical protein
VRTRALFSGFSTFSAFSTASSGRTGRATTDGRRITALSFALVKRPAVVEPTGDC